MLQLNRQAIAPHDTAKSFRFCILPSMAARGNRGMQSLKDFLHSCCTVRTLAKQSAIPAADKNRIRCATTKRSVWSLVEASAQTLLIRDQPEQQSR